MNMSLENKAHFLAEKEAIHLILTGIGNDIYSTVDACQTTQEIWEAIERNNLTVTMMQVNVQFLQQLQPELSRFVTIVKQQHKLDEVSYHKLFDILKQYQNEVNELRAEKLARNANPLALVAISQASQDQYYQTSISHRSTPSPKHSIPSRSHTTTRHKGNEIAKPITPPSETAFEEDNDHEQAQRDKDMQKNLALNAKYFKKTYKPTNNNLRTSSNSKNKNVDTTPRFKNENQSGRFGNQRTVNVVAARENVGSKVVQQSGIQCFNCREFGHFAKECRKPKRVKDSAYHKEKMLLCKQAEQGVPLQAEQYDWLADTDEEVDEQELEAHYSYMAKIQETKQAEFEKYKAFNDCTIDYDILERKLNEALGQLAHKDTTQSDSLKFVLELKQEMHADLKYVESLEKEIDELESDKAEFSDIYDEILQDCVSKDVMCSYLQSLSDLDALAELQCMYLHKVKECDCLARKLLKQTKSVSKKVHTELLQRFAKVEKHSISLELDLQKRKEQVKMTHELKKLIEKGKGKFVDTKFDRPSVVRQPNAQQIPKPSVLVTAQTLPQKAKKAVSKTNVLEPEMYRIDNRTAHTRAPQLPQTVRITNPRVSTSTGVNHKPTVSRLKLKSNQSRDKYVTACKESLNSRTLNANDVCATCNKCLFDSNHFACVMKMLNDVHTRTKNPTVVPISTRKPKSQANKSIATPRKKKVASKPANQKPQSYFRVLYENTNKAWNWWIERQSPSGYKWVPKLKKQWVPKAKMQWVPKAENDQVPKRIVQLILFIVDSGCTKHMTGNLKLLYNFVEKFLGTVRFGNDQFSPILGYGNLVQGNVTINRVYYVEGLNHNLFSVGQFCDADLEVAFRKSTCFVRDLQGNYLLVGNRVFDLYTISLQESTSSTPLYLMAKATPTQAWLWHRRLSHLNFNYINLLSKKDIMIGLPKLKYVKDQLCSSCELSKAKRSLFKSKVVPSSKGMLNLLHMDLCGPMRVASINGKKYILSKGYRVYKKRTRMIVKSIHIRFDETKEVSETSVANNTSGLVPQRQKASDYDNPDPVPQRQDVYSSADADVPSQQELDLLFGPLYDEFFNAGTNPSTNIHSTSAPSTHTNVHAEENNNDQAGEGEQLQDDEFTNPFCAPAQEEAESSSHNVGNSNVPTFNQPQVSEYRWTKDYPLEQVRGNPSRPVQTRRQLATDPEMCMYALTVSTAEPKNIKEEMADSAWIEAMQEELHQSDRL
uniref:CCHC-type domain-containing protein n=1 Tax=Tanacetum cinerariifolium TaxID=118510 RepID=A0A6L2MSG7_TANCI|nr:hypothetical protein [Tanacetum cinerariifolium]